MTNIHIESKRLRGILDSGNITESDVQAALEHASKTYNASDRVIYTRMKAMLDAQNEPKVEEVTQPLTAISADVVEAARLHAKETGHIDDRVEYAKLKTHFDRYNEQQQQVERIANDSKLKSLEEKLAETEQAISNPASTGGTLKTQLVTVADFYKNKLAEFKEAQQ